MQAKHYRKFKRWHTSAHESILIQAVKIKKQPFRRWAVQWSYWHKAKALENNIKWYDEFNKTAKFGADVQQIRRDFNYPDFDPKRGSGFEEETEFVGWGNLAVAKFVRMCPPGCGIHTEDQHSTKYAREGNVDGIN